MNDQRRNLLLETYVKFVEKNGLHPSHSDLEALGISRSKIRHNFGSITQLMKAAKESKPKAFTNIFDGQLFTPEKHAALKDAVAKKQRFVVTTAVTGCKVHTGFWASLNKYCEIHDAQLLVVTSSDPAAISNYKRYVDPVLSSANIVFEKLALNSKLMIHPIKLSAKHIDPITGLGRIGQRNGSFIYASPKQRLKLVPTSNTEMPVALMTTGACTLPDYSSDRFMSHRTAHIADHDHVIGAIIVEVDDERRFHFRQVQANHKGHFANLGKMYGADGAQEYLPEALILGDLHDGETDPVAFGAMITDEDSVLNVCKPKKIFIHDGFNGLSVNHHEAKNTITQALKTITLHEELYQYFLTLNKLSKLFAEVNIVKSNHDDFLNRYIQDGGYIHDPANLDVALKIATAMMAGKDPVQAGVELHGALPPNIRWLEYDEDYKIAGVECGAHGHRGSNGARGSLKAMENAYGNSISGHAHTPEILRGAWQVGTTSRLNLSYNKGPSSWLHSSCLLYSNGQRQVLNVIDGRWHI